MSLSRHQAVGAYRRWDPPAFDGTAQPAPEAPPADAPAAQPAEPQTPPEPSIQLPTADDIEGMFEQARAEGEAIGYAEGAARARNEAEHLAALAREVDQALVRLDADIAEEVVALAVEIARQMVGRTLAVEPTVVADTVKAALLQLPQNQVRIHLHPVDLALVRTHLADAVEHGHHRLVEDPGVTRGGCRLEGTGSEIDATVETRWRRIIEGLARDDTAWERT